MKPNATVLAAGVVLLAWFAGPARAQEEVTLPEGDGKALTGAVCSQCHGLGPLFFLKADDRKWEILVHEMVSFGAQISTEERDAIMSYVKSTFSSDSARAGTGPTPLPAGKGREVLERSCDGCHGLSVITRTRVARTGWDAILRRHTAGRRVELSPEGAEALLAYLAANFAAITPRR